MGKSSTGAKMSSRLACTVAAFLLLAVAAPAHASDVDEWIGVIGVSSDGKRYAVCRSTGWDEDRLRDECIKFQAPPEPADEGDGGDVGEEGDGADMGDGADEGTLTRTICVCRTVADPPATDDAIKQLCEKAWQVEGDSTPLESIESEVKGMGIRLGDSVRHLPVRGGQFEVPAEVAIAFGVGAPMEVSWSNPVTKTRHGQYAESEWLLEFRADGYGKVSIRQGRSDHGVWQYTLNTVSLASGTPWLFYNVGTAMEAARYTLPWAIRLDHVAARLVNSRGFRRHKSGDFAGSASDFSQAFALNPGYGQAAFNAACAEARLGNAEKSLEFLKQAIGLEPAVFKQKARKDPDLRSIRGEKEFGTLVR